MVYYVELHTAEAMTQHIRNAIEMGQGGHVCPFVVFEGQAMRRHLWSSHLPVVSPSLLYSRFS